MKNRSWLVLLASVMVGAFTLSAVPTRAVAEDATCGTKDNPCPLQKWMITNMGPALAASDLPALAKALDRSAAFSPDASWTWPKMAKDGAEAAKKGDIAGAKAACKSCHEAYKQKYKAQFRPKPIN